MSDRHNPIARDLRTPKYRSRTVEGGRREYDDWRQEVEEALTGRHKCPDGFCPECDDPRDNSGW